MLCMKMPILTPRIMQTGRCLRFWFKCWVLAWILFVNLQSSTSPRTAAGQRAGPEELAAQEEATRRQKGAEKGALVRRMT